MKSAQLSYVGERQTLVTNHLRPPPLPVIELVKINLPAKRVPVNSEKASGPRLIATGPVEHALDEFFFEFVDGFIEVDSALHHLAD